MTSKPKSAKGDWTKQVRWDLEWAKRAVLEDGGISSIFLVHTTDEVLYVKLDSDRAEKQDFYSLLRCLCIARNANALSFISEAWMRLAPLDKINPEYPEVMPRDAEDRIEVLIAQVCYMADDGKHFAVQTCEIKRDRNNKVTGFSDNLPELDPDKAGGMITRILPNSPPPPAVRELAQSALPVIAEALGFNMQTIDLDKGGTA